MEKHLVDCETFGNVEIEITRADPLGKRKIWWRAPDKTLSLVGYVHKYDHCNLFGPWILRNSEYIIEGTFPHSLLYERIRILVIVHVCKWYTSPNNVLRYIIRRILSLEAKPAWHLLDSESKNALRATFQQHHILQLPELSFRWDEKFICRCFFPEDICEHAELHVSVKWEANHNVNFLATRVDALKTIMDFCQEVNIILKDSFENLRKSKQLDK
jgi:hypothetical protein